jgi:NAD(P)-dependent dehydrogenase (short-subunit alcohol dehydrogenase family)
MDFAGRVVLVTGASRGIGAAVAERFAAAGAHIVAVARDETELTALDDRIRAAGGDAATLVPLDVTNGEALDRLGGTIAERYGHLDVLVGNAALLGDLGPLSHIEPRSWDRVLEVDLTANWRLIRATDALLRAADAGRAIFVTSGVGSRPRAYWGAYAVAKAGLEGLMRVYAAEVAKSQVRVNALDPGKIRTAMRAKAMPGEDPQTLVTPDAITDAFLALASPDCTRNGEVVKAQAKAW